MKTSNRFEPERFCQDCLERVEYINNPPEIEKKFGVTYYCNPCDEYLTVRDTLSKIERENKINNEIGVRR